MVVEAAAAMLQQHTRRGRLDYTPGVMLLEPRQQVLPGLWGKRRDRLRQMMSLDRKDRKLLVTAPVTACMAGDLGGITLAHSLPKGVNARHQALILLVGIRHLEVTARCHG